MGIFSNLFGSFGKNVIVQYERGHEMKDKGFAFGNKNKDYLEWSLTNPALNTVIALRSKMFSRMRITHVKENRDEIENSKVLELLKAPNFYQSQNDFLFQLMWLTSAWGYNYIWTPGKDSDGLPVAMYNLNVGNVVKSSVDTNDFKFVLDDEQKQQISEQQFRYKVSRNEEKVIKFGDVIPIYDLGGNLMYDKIFTSPSRIEQITKVLQNIDENLKSKNMNLKFSSKYMVKNKKNLDGQPLLTDDDRSSIYSRLGKESVIITDSDVEGSHLISDFKRLFLDEMFANDALKVAAAFEMNKDVINYYGTDSTFENQKQGVIKWIQNSLQSDADNTMLSISDSLGLLEKGEMLKASYDGLPLMQEYLASKYDTLGNYQSTLIEAINNQLITVDEARGLLDTFRTKFEIK